MKKKLLTIGTIILLCTITLSGCNEQKKPVISSFAVVPNEIEVGETAYLQWTVTDATLITINNGIGTVPSSGNKSISPITTTIYTLTATGSEIVTATTTITVTEPIEKPNITIIQTNFYIDITETKNGHVLQSEAQVIAVNKNSLKDQTSALGPLINEADGNPMYLGAGDVITFRNLSDFSVGELWDIQVSYHGDIIGQCMFKNPEGPYDSPVVRMTRSNTSVIIIGIINGPIDQERCSIIAENTTSHAIQTTQLGATFSDSYGNPTVLEISDRIIFSSLSKFKKNDEWNIRLDYNGNIIGQCLFINPGSINLIPS